VGILAGRLLRKFPEIGKPQDGIHLATALLNNVDELHTYDRKDLIGLSGRIDRKDGVKLKICAPPPRPVSSQPEKTPMEQFLDELEEAARSRGKK
jgi:hypothetical protein